MHINSLVYKAFGLRTDYFKLEKVVCVHRSIIFPAQELFKKKLNK